MGSAIFLEFSLKCFDLLAWPLFALGFPLCASIRAIETNSKSQLRKLITYWILFSLISLFELAFAILIDWVPYWQYIKLIAICWLVIPRFNGAYHVYQRLIHPCLSMNLRAVINHSYKLKEESSLKTENFLALAEKYVKENGSEALEKLIVSEDAKPNHNVQEIKAVANSEKNEATATIQDKHAEANHSQTQKKTVVAVDVKEMISPTAGEENKVREISALKKVQNEWACAVCQVIITSEANLNSHLQGRKHRVKYEELKAKINAAKNAGSSSPTTDELSQAIPEPEKFASADASNQGKTRRRKRRSKCEPSATQADKSEKC